jgi:hypothetical protein
MSALPLRLPRVATLRDLSYQASVKLIVELGTSGLHIPATRIDSMRIDFPKVMVGMIMAFRENGGAIDPKECRGSAPYVYLHEL